MEVSCPVVKIISLSSTPSSFYFVSGSKIFFVSESGELKECFKHPEGKKWSSVAALSEDETFMAVCDNEKNLHVFVVGGDKIGFQLKGVPMRLAKTATSVKFTDFPSLNTVVVADKFGDVLRFEMEGFEGWAVESRADSKTLSIHARKSVSLVQNKKRTIEEVEETKEEAEDKEEEQEQANCEEVEGEVASEAHHCTIIGHISMITDLQILPIDKTPGGLIITSDRDEKIRLTRADRPELIHSFALAHREYLGSIAVSGEGKTFFGAGGDSFVSEWKLEDSEKDPYGQLKLLSKINLLPSQSDGTPVAVQEIHANSRGDLLTILVEEVGIFVYSKSGGEWSLKGKIENENITAFDYKNGSIVYSTWNRENGINECFIVDVSEAEDKDKLESKVVLALSSTPFDKMTAEEAQEMLSLLSKKKLRKDIERMDWKQKKHSNQKPKQ